jgi:simple sugar transport system permease protein
MLPVVGTYVVSIAVALALCAVLVSATGGSARRVMSALLDGSLRSPGAWGLTITNAAPLLIVAVGTIVAGKAGMANIGQEGQLLLGAATTAFVATRLGGPGWIVLSVSFLAGAVVGGAWAALAALMRFGRKVPEVMSTLLLVFIASQITTFGLTRKWLLLSKKNDTRTNNGEPLPARSHLPSIRLLGNVISWGAVIALVVTLVVAFVLARTTIGFRIRMLGLNQRTAARAGVSAAAVGGAALAFSGATSGLAGGLWLTGGAAGDRFTAAISSNIGWQGLLVALLARERAVIAIPMAFVFAALRTGSGFLAATGVDRRIADVVQAMLVLALLVPPAVQAVQQRRRGTAGAA